MTSGPIIDIVICTYNNSGLLDDALAAIARQSVPPGVEWSVLVVDNNSTDDTPLVVDRHRHLGRIPGLARVHEPIQGLTHARLCGVRNTTAPWVAFVDDDCLLDENWVAGAAAFAGAHPDCGAFGGRVELQWDVPPPAHVKELGWAFAEQDPGPDAVQVECLVGTGMVVSRAALEDCGWAAGPLLADRIGKKLVSGGDVELALRIRSVRPLWYTPHCVLRHVISSRRTSLRYMLSLTRGLGVSKTYGDAMPWSGSYATWAWWTVLDSLHASAVLARRAAGMMAREARGGETRAGKSRLAEMLLSASFVQGRWVGIVRMLRLRAGGRCQFFGCARVLTDGGH